MNQYMSLKLIIIFKNKKLKLPKIKKNGANYTLDIKIYL